MNPASSAEHDQLEASIKGLPEEETNRRASRLMDMAQEIASRPAHTAIGAMVKLRVMHAYMRHGDCDWYALAGGQRGRDPRPPPRPVGTR